MVDRVDKPDAPPPYLVKSPTETKKDKPKEERRQEDLPTFQQGKEEALYREKFQGETGVLKTVKIALEEVDGFLFKRAIPRHGVPMVDTELVWKNGKKLSGVSFLLKNWQDFMQIKNIKAGEKIPPPFWNYGGTYLEITIRSTQTSGPWNLREITTEAKTQPPPVALIPWWKNNKALLGIGLGALGVALFLILILLGS